MNKLQGKVIVITGASGGIGKEVAIQARKQGGRLVLLARSLDKLHQLRYELTNQYGVDAYAYKLDVADTDQVEMVFGDIHAQIGEVDVLVNNAGFGTFKEALDTELDETKAMFAVNVIGLMACTKLVLPYMKLAENRGISLILPHRPVKLPLPNLHCILRPSLRCLAIQTRFDLN